MGKDAHADGDPCCYACERWGSGDEAAAVERPVLDVPAPARTKMIVRDARTGATITEYVPDKEQVWIGRGKLNEISIHDGAVSRRQTLFVFREGAVYVADSGSTCGTFVDGVLIERARLGAGAVVSFANYEVVVVTG